MRQRGPVGRRREEAATSESTQPLSRLARATMLALLTALLGTVAVGSRATVGTTGGTAPASPAGRIPLETLAVPSILAVLAGLGLLAFVLRPVRRWRRDPEQPDLVYEPPPTTWTEKAFLLLALLVFVAAVVGTLWLVARHGAPSQPRTLPTTVPQSTSATAPAPTIPPSMPASPTSPPQTPWLWPIAGIAALAAVSGLLALWMVHRRRGPARSPRPAADPLADLLDASTDDLGAEPDPRQAILAAYARMERALTPRGVGRQRHETAMEYLNRVLARLELEPAPLQRLTSLFELARFSNHKVTERMRDDALAALGAISAALRGSP